MSAPKAASVFTADAIKAATVHCSGATGDANVWRRIDHALLHASSRAADVAALYNGFYQLGLQYGPGYRTLVQAWGSGIQCVFQIFLKRGYRPAPCHVI